MNTELHLKKAAELRQGLYAVGSTARAIVEGRSIRGMLELLAVGVSEGEVSNLSSVFESAFADDGLQVALFVADSLAEHLTSTKPACDAIAVPLGVPTSHRAVEDWCGPVDTEAALTGDGVLRLAIRFAEVGWTHSDALINHGAQAAFGVCTVSKKAQFNALNQILLSKYPSDGFRFLEACGALPILLPELSGLQGFHLTSPHHHKDVYEHTLQVVSQSVPKAMVRWAALLHDIGKLHTRSFTDDGQVHFFKHDVVGAYLCDGIFARLDFPTNLAKGVRLLVRLHLRPGLYTPQWSDAAVRRFTKEAGSHLNDLMSLARADNTTKRMQKRLANLRNVKALKLRCEKLLESDAAPQPRLPSGLGGAIQRYFELEQGPRIGELCDICLSGLQNGLIPQNASIENHLEYLRNEVNE